MEKTKKYLKIGDAAKYVGVSQQTLRNYQDRGILIPAMILDSGHRLYSLEQLKEFIEREEAF